MTARLLPALAIVLLLNAADTLADSVPMDPNRWEVEGTHAFVDHEGRRALRLDGARAWLRDVEFRDGTIEFDLYAPDAWSFHYLIFRSIDGANGEEFYIRPSQSGRDDAMQYTPRHSGLSAWQLYFGEGYWGNATFAFDRWMRFRFEIRGQEMQVFVDADEPVLVARLMRPAASGRLALASRRAPAYFANFSFEPAVSASPPQAAEGVGAPAVIRDWEISESFPEAEIDARSTSSAGPWTSLTARASGIVNVAEHVPFVRSTQDTVLLRTTIPRGAAEKITFGYSDRVVVFYNGRRIYAGSTAWRSRDFRYLGSMGLFDAVFVDTAEAEVNELVFAVSESFGGWGLIAAGAE